MSKYKALFLPLLIVSLLVIQLMSPATVFADGEPPPPAEEATQPEEPVDSEEASSEETVPADEPADAEETPAADETAEEQEPPAEEEAPAEELAPVDEAPPEDAPQTEPAEEPLSESEPEDLTVAEALEQAPAETEIVVVDEDGQVEPLATEEATEIVEEADPIWCPEGVTPEKLQKGCSPSYTNLTDLITWLLANDPKQAGTIWIEKKYDSKVNDPNIDNFTLSGGSFQNFDQYALTVQGGWEGLGSTAVDTSDPSTFNGASLSITSWNAPISVKDIVVTSVTTGFGSGLRVNTMDGDIHLENVQSNKIDRGVNTLNIGIYAYTRNGSIIANDLTANQNGDKNTGSYGLGARLYSNNGAIFLTGDNSFNTNSYSGLDAYARGGEIIINNLTTNENGQYGSRLNNSGAFNNISILSGEVHSNNMGMNVWTEGQLALRCVDFYNNQVDLKQGSGTLVEYCQCVTPVTSEPEKAKRPALPILQVATGEDTVDLDCKAYRGTQMSLPNGDAALFPCPITDSANLSGEFANSGDLPGGLLLGSGFHSAFTTEVTRNGETVDKLPTFVTLAFAMPEGTDPATLAILFWDGSDWVELSDGLKLAEGKRVGNAGFLSPDGSFFQATVNFTGTFALVSK